MVAQCQVSAGAYSFPPSAFQVLSISTVFLPLFLRFWDTSRLFLPFFWVCFFFQFPNILDHYHWHDLDFLKHFSFSCGKLMSLSGICPLSSLRTQAKNSFHFFFLNNALTTCVNKLPLPFLRGPSASFTALSFRMCLKNVIFILTPAGIFLCSIPHFGLCYCV